MFNAFTKFSGQYMYSDVYMTLFNVVFTALTPIIIGIFDRDVDRDMAMHYPAMYKQGGCEKVWLTSYVLNLCKSLRQQV